MILSGICVKYEYNYSSDYFSRLLQPPIHVTLNSELRERSDEQFESQAHHARNNLRRRHPAMATEAAKLLDPTAAPKYCGFGL